MTVQELIDKLSALPDELKQQYTVDSDGCDCIDTAGDIEVVHEQRRVIVMRERA